MNDFEPDFEAIRESTLAQIGDIISDIHDFNPHANVAPLKDAGREIMKAINLLEETCLRFRGAIQLAVNGPIH